MDHKSALRGFVRGARDGLPISLGYISVSFSIGIMAVGSGLSAWVAVLISAVNLTSAGQVAGIAVLAAGGPLAEMALTQLVINIRYALMSLSLSQKLSPDFTTPHRLIAGYGITDEIFAVASAQQGSVTPGYLYGMILVAAAGWVGGTLLGAVAGGLLPDLLKNALGIAIYGMFLAIVLPPARINRAVMLCALVASALSCALAYLPLFDFISDGFAVIICTLIAAAVAALVHPIREEAAE